MNKVSIHLNNILPGTVLEAYKDRKSNQEVICIPPEKLHEVVDILKNELFFDMLIDIICIDWLNKKEKRFEMDYLFYSTKDNCRVHLKCALTNNEKPEIDSICDLYSVANWCERECWDMMGIHINNHPNLKRLLMWEAFEGHPLRKDYPIDKRQPIPVLDKLI